MKPAFTVLLILVATATTAQTPKSAEIFPADQIHQKFVKAAEEAKANGSGGAVLADYGSHNLRISTRAADGGAEIHAHFTDIFYITKGEATLVTGGTVVDPMTNADGETLGKSIRNGDTRQIVTGDLVHIPAGMPHQLLIPKGTVLNYIVVKVRE